MRKTTTEKLASTRAAIVRWERKLRFAAGKLAKYRAMEARLVRRQAEDAAKLAKGLTTGTGRKFDLGTESAQ
jgi:hypothetical protein